MDQTEKHELAINLSMLQKINFACHQSSFAVLRELIVKNPTDDDLHDLTLNLVSSPPFLKSKTWKIDRLIAGGQLPIRDRDIQLDGGFLLDLSESMKGLVTFSLLSGGALLAEEVCPVELLAVNEWGGNRYMPELLAAYCTPNDPVVDRILGDASKLLRKAGKPDALDGYKSASRERVWVTASAIYSAIAKMQLGYALPPSSFELNGQKIRLPSSIADSRLATCLDTTLLFAGAFEQAGLNPLIILVEGHALVGLWLEPEDLSGVMITEAELLRQRISLKELILIETTFVTQSPPLSFSQALVAGQRVIALDKDDKFEAALDVRRARGHHINPLSLRLVTNSSTGTVAEDVQYEPMLEDAPSLPSNNVFIEDDQPVETAKGRLDRWQRKLLDLSARNPLLNQKPGRTSLNFVCADPALLEDMLAAGARISIATFPKLQGDEQDTEIYEQRHGDELKETYARDALSKKQLLVDISPQELDKSSVEIYRKAQTSLKEGGSNTLFLAIGFLLWKQKDKAARSYRAPLILLPVTLERKSVRSGIQLIASDDEPRFNTTLLEMLKKDFGIEIRGLEGALPQDDSGVDVNGIWNRVRHAIKDISGFEVIEDVVLGHFSFAKYLMWKDLVDRADELRESAVVRHLLDTPRDPYSCDIKFVEAVDLDRSFAPADLFTPLPADSSQMAAVATADRGKDFVIIGPPGTGKSQTIGNLIAHMLGKGKKVLFVSEKTAALEVVHRRLKEIGLGSFCLELHSNKAKKADVLEQLRTSWSKASQSSADEWQQESVRLKSLRDRLNAMVNTLHKRHSNGMTAHYAMGVKIRDEDIATKVKFSWPRADFHSQQQLQELRETVGLLQVQASVIGSMNDHPLQVISNTDWSPQWQESLTAVARQLDAEATQLNRHVQTLEGALRVEFGTVSLPKLLALNEFGQVLLDSYRKHSSFALEPDGPDRLDALEEVVTLLKDYISAQTRFSCSYESLAWQKLDAASLQQAWTEANATWWPKRWFAKRRIVKQMQAGGAKGEPNVDQDIEVLAHLRQTGNRIERLEGMLNGLKGWASYDTDPEVMVSLRVLGSRAREAIGKLAHDSQSLAELRSKIRTLMYDANDLLASDAPVGRSVTEFHKSLVSFTALKDRFEALSGSAVIANIDSSLSVLDETKILCQDITKHQVSLKEWCSWMRRRTQAIDCQLGALVDAIEQGVVLSEEVSEVFEAAYCTWWSAAVIGEDALLRSFSSAEHEDTINKFRELDTRFSDLTADYIAAKLSGKIPDQDEIRRSSSWGVLRHELQKKSRHKPVREMMEIMPDVITTLAPCLMMSPLSVAQFLAAGQALFDVVIFDEASQITVWDAVGSLARGKQVIVAGDPKQMPPTNFFARADNDPDSDMDDEGDLESILDELIGASIPQQVLNLHYRSRKESLIAFSNSRYYDNSLVTFPAPLHPDNGVSLVKPEGFYARGKARHNQGEAKAIVAEILRRLTSKDDALRSQSIGVVTFNTEQQSLIEDLLDKARADDPSIEWAFSDEVSLEPVFVKNLESVQGDERDVIFFSITYGPDESDHITMNFGPLNRNGGERRLNVAMTRARSEMVVFSTLSPERIDLSRTASRAVADLKHFLEYAERGAAALGAAVHGSLGDFESPFEIAVARELQAKGWIVHTQIGVSAYRIDLGIVHPDLPGVYLAGIECDGAMYHSSAYARERDKIRQTVLEGLGWNILRIWSADWWINKGAETSTIDHKLHELLEIERNKKSNESLINDSHDETYLVTNKIDDIV
jgi:very-short-patch-repair endonuclease